MALGAAGVVSEAEMTRSEGRSDAIVPSPQLFDLGVEAAHEVTKLAQSRLALEALLFRLDLVEATEFVVFALGDCRVRCLLFGSSLSLFEPATNERLGVGGQRRQISASVAQQRRDVEADPAASVAAIGSG